MFDRFKSILPAICMTSLELFVWENTIKFLYGILIGKMLLRKVSKSPISPHDGQYTILIKVFRFLFDTISTVIDYLCY